MARSSRSGPPIRKNYALTTNDVTRLKQLSERFEGASETKILRVALLFLEKGAESMDEINTVILKHPKTGVETITIVPV